VNQYTSTLIRENLEEIGLKYNEDHPDYIFVNMCSLTNNAVKKARLLLNRIKRENPDSEIVLTGCFEEDSNLETDYKIHTRDRDKIYDLFDSNYNKRDYVSGFHEHTRAFVMIQEGCQNFCSYCIVPYMRDRMYSKPIEVFKIELENIVKNGYKEVVLTGTHINKYSYKGNRLSDLVKIIENIDGIERFRISSIEPDDIDEDFIRTIKASKKFQPHLHLSLQSGSDEILKKMKRNYTLKSISKLIERIRREIPDFELSLDIIAGFPGESEKQFQKSMAFIKKHKPILVHAFPFSKRKGTEAYSMREFLSNKEKKERAARLRSLTEEIKKVYLKKYIDKELLVLVEKEDNGFYTGYSGNYIKVYIKDEKKEKNTGKIIKVKIQRVFKDGLKGSFK